MMPAVHCAITKAGLEMMNSGAAMAGRASLPSRRLGSDMRLPRIIIIVPKGII
jgi:hypothetical protein